MLHDLKIETFRRFNELGGLQRAPHTPTDCRRYNRYAHLWDWLGQFIGKHFVSLMKLTSIRSCRLPFSGWRKMTNCTVMVLT